MRKFFADRSYWIALTSRNDPYHEIAMQLSKTIAGGRIVTSEMVLVEFLNFFSEKGEIFRQAAVSMIDRIFKKRNVRVYQQTHELFTRAFDLYRNRMDKGYSLTDGSMMVLAEERAIQDVLSAAPHYEQQRLTAQTPRHSGTDPPCHPTDAPPTQSPPAPLRPAPSRSGKTLRASSDARAPRNAAPTSSRPCIHVRRAAAARSPPSPRPRSTTLPRPRQTAPLCFACGAVEAAVRKPRPAPPGPAAPGPDRASRAPPPRPDTSVPCCATTSSPARSLEPLRLAAVGESTLEPHSCALAPSRSSASFSISASTMQGPLPHPPPGSNRPITRGSHRPISGGSHWPITRGSNRPISGGSHRPTQGGSNYCGC